VPSFPASSDVIQGIFGIVEPNPVGIYVGFGEGNSLRLVDGKFAELENLGTFEADGNRRFAPTVVGLSR
jgi:hypothetical protein